MTSLLTGKEIAQMDDYALRARVESCNLFCRGNPAQKNRIILALKARQHVVGYLLMAELAKQLFYLCAVQRKR